MYFIALHCNKKKLIETIIIIITIDDDTHMTKTKTRTRPMKKCVYYAT